MAHFVPCHKEITTKELADLFINHCYRLHDVPKVIVSDRDPKFVGKFWQTFMGTFMGTFIATVQFGMRTVQYAT
jgi:hypothetical protein